MQRIAAVFFLSLCQTAKLFGSPSLKSFEGRSSVLSLLIILFNNYGGEVKHSKKEPNEDTPLKRGPVYGFGPNFLAACGCFLPFCLLISSHCRAAINPVQNNRIADKLPFGMFQLTKTLLREIADETDLTVSLIHVIGDS